MTEYEIQEGFSVQVYGSGDWFPTVDYKWWIEHHAMCNAECAVEVERGDGSGFRIGWSELCSEMDKLHAEGPYREDSAFKYNTVNMDTALSDDLLMVVGWVDVEKVWLVKSPLVAAMLAHKAAAYDGDWALGYGADYVVGIGRGGYYASNDEPMDVYVNPNIDDDYDIAQWNVQLAAYDRDSHSHHPVWDTSGGLGDSIDGLEGTGYPYGVNKDRMPLVDASSLFDIGQDHTSIDPRPTTYPELVENEGWPAKLPFMVIGAGGMFAIGTDYRVHEIGAVIN